MQKNFYKLSHGWATRYYWLSFPKEQVSKDAPFWEFLYSGHLVLKKSKGSTPADILGSTMGLSFYSQRFIDFLKINNLTNFKAYPVKSDNSLKFDCIYYYIELTSEIKRIEGGPDVVENYCRTNGIARENIIHLIFKTYTDISTWDGSEIFKNQNSTGFLMTEKVKKLLENSEMTNIEIRQLRRITELNFDDPYSPKPKSDTGKGSHK